MKETIIYGASDDLIEIEGAIHEECNHYEDQGIRFSASDGTRGEIKYDGEWRITVMTEGKLFSRLIKAPGECDGGGNALYHTDEYRKFPAYSDILELKEGIEWVKIADKKIFA